MQMFFSTREAAGAAYAAPKDEFYDARGIVLTRVKQKSGSLTLEARGKANPKELKERLMTELREAAKLEAPGGPQAAEANAVIAWLAAAPPDPSYLMHALTLAEPEYDISITAGGRTASTFAVSTRRRCRKCTWIQRRCWGVPPCCKEDD